jgi:hypothetical protein
MTQPTAATKQEAKIEAALQMVDTTYFLLIDDEYEKKAAKEYLRQMYPGTAARIVNELRLDRLTDKHHVIALVRGNERSPALALVANHNGIRELRATPVAELMREVVESKPVRCADYWQPAREGNEGEVALGGFLEDLGKKAAPAALKYYPQQGLLKLGFA